MPLELVSKNNGYNELDPHGHEYVMHVGIFFNICLSGKMRNKVILFLRLFFSFECFILKIKYLNSKSYF